MRLVKLIGIFTLVSLLSACSWFGGDEKEIPDIPEQQLYTEALEALDAGEYETATEKLQLLEARYPFGRYSEQAQLELIYAYFKSSEPEAARAAADRFIRLHPNHENIDYAYYLKGLTAFEQDRSVFERYLPIDETQRDPGAALESFESFAALLNKYPDSEYAPDAQKRMVYLKNRLAQYEIHVAHYYIKRRAWVAAANRGRYVVENMQETPAVPDALAVMIESYTALGMHDLAGDAQQVLRTNFPDYEYVPQAKRKAGLLETATFGLMGGGEAEAEQVVKPKQRSQVKIEAEEDDDSSFFDTITFGIFEDDEDEEKAAE